MNNRQAIKALVRKDIRAITASIQLWLPMLIVPLIIGVTMPAILIWLASRVELRSIGNIGFLLDSLDILSSSGQIPELAPWLQTTIALSIIWPYICSRRCF